ncbi:hypothetical protein [Paenibacillus elgii]|uniref:DUF7832 domain-containing protein n=1 Tax=Paenibacillus elgii TaxID=189691 RepID=UPI001ED96ADE|nr:hypothetical protein [Paenibacillus elgii]
MDLGRTMTKKIETVVTKQRKTFKDYVHLAITEGPQVYILNVIKGRLYPDKKTMNPTYEPYPAKQEAVDRLNASAEELKAKGFAEEPTDVLFRIKEKELYVFDKAKWHYEGDFPQELDVFQAYVPTGMFVAWVIKNDLLRKRSRKRDLPDEADAFAREYLNIHNDIYTATDFAEILAAGLPTIYHVEDTIENYRIIEPVISERYRVWKRDKHI